MERKGKRRESEGKGVEGRQSERWRDDEDFFAFRTTDESSQTHRGEWKRLVSLAFQLRSEPVYSHS